VSTPTTSTDDPILDAARATVLDFGISRMTVSEVARRAGVSRMTVYRRYPDSETLLKAVMAREFTQTIALGVEANVQEPDACRRLVSEAMQALVLLLDNPVLRRLIEVDVHQLVPYFAVAAGRFQDAVVAQLRNEIEAGQRAGQIRAGDPGTMAETIELAFRGPVLATHTLSGDRRARVLDELETFLTRFLQP
jgi:AcrR family transcriptional regulator